MQSPQKLWQSYVQELFESKRQIVLQLLEWIKEGQELLENIYRFISDAPASLEESDLDETYSALLKVAYEMSQAHDGENYARLEWIVDKIARMREEETQDRDRDRAEVVQALTNEHLIF